MTVKLVYRTDDGKIWDNQPDANKHNSLLGNINAVEEYIRKTVTDPMFTKFYPLLLNNRSAIREMADLLVMSNIAAFVESVLKQ